MSKHTKKIKFKPVKSDNKISKKQIGSFKPTHIMFNLSFITTNNDYSFSNSDFNPDHKAHLLERMHELSSVNYTAVLNFPKNRGIEFIHKSELQCEAKYNPEFERSEFRKNCSEKFAVFRLYTNNNPIAARIIGKVKTNIFYVLYIDLYHGMYKG